MTLKDKRDMWYVSGNKKEGNVFAIPVTEIEAGATLHNAEIAQLKSNDTDGTRRWVVVAGDGDEAIDKLVSFLSV